MWMFQSTPLREGRRADTLVVRCRAVVSIHAPARGATLCNASFKSAPLGFNPRPCARGDIQDAVLLYSSMLFQSTPARGATKVSSTGVFAGPFQSTPLREGRPNRPKNGGCCYVFQSTPLREGRQPSDATPSKRLMFQSTPLREGRHRYPR